MQRINIGILVFFSMQISAVMADDERKLLWLKNEVLEVAVDLESGGGLCHFSRVGEANVLNGYDRGRLVQQSFYGDEDGSKWEKRAWRYNPVQGGDYKGVASVVVDSKQESELIFVRTTPRHWASGKLLPECVMEETLRLEGEVLKVEFRFRYDGGKIHAAHHQELPAVFVEGTYSQLVNYRGDAPWSGAELTRQTPGWPNIYGRSTEEWSAWVDAHGRGVGIFTPGTKEWTAYRFKGDEKVVGSECSYVAPYRTLALTPGLTVKYDAYLTIGNLEEIRERFRRIAIGK